MSEKLSKNAIKILRKVKRHILAEPKRIRMGIWKSLDASEDGYKLIPRCNTIGCIGGWTEILAKSRMDAGTILGIDGAQRGELFFNEPLCRARNQQTTAHARAVAKHIDKFIAKYR